MQLFLDIEKAGEHEIMISLREDGFEMDKFVLARNKAFQPEGKGPAVKVKAGRLPAPGPRGQGTGGAATPDASNPNNMDPIDDWENPSNIHWAGGGVPQDIVSKLEAEVDSCLQVPISMAGTQRMEIPGGGTGSSRME